MVFTKKPADRFSDLLQRGIALRNEVKDWSSPEEFARSDYGKLFKQTVTCKPTEHTLALWRDSAPKKRCAFCERANVPCQDPPSKKSNSEQVKCAECLARSGPCSLIHVFHAWLVEQCLGVNAADCAKYNKWIKEASAQKPKQRTLDRPFDSDQSSEEEDSDPDSSDDAPPAKRLFEKSHAAPSTASSSRSHQKEIVTPLVRAPATAPPHHSSVGRGGMNGGASNANGHDSPTPSRSSKRKRAEDSGVSASAARRSRTSTRLSGAELVGALEGKLTVEMHEDKQVIVLHRLNCPNVVFDPPYHSSDEDGAMEIESLSEVFSHLYRLEYASSKGNLEKEVRSILEEKDRKLRAELKKELEAEKRRIEEALEKQRSDSENQLRTACTRAQVVEEEMKILERERDEAKQLLQSAQGILQTVKEKEEKWSKERQAMSKERDELTAKLGRTTPDPGPSSISRPPSSSDVSRQHSKLSHETRRANAAEELLERHGAVASALMQDLGSVSSWLDGYSKHHEQPDLEAVARELFSITGRLSVLAYQARQPTHPARSPPPSERRDSGRGQ